MATTEDEYQGGPDQLEEKLANLDEELADQRAAALRATLADYERALIDKLCKGFPTAFRYRMWDRAKEANTRLCDGLGPNVYKVDFKSKKKYG